MNHIPLVDLKTQYLSIKSQIDSALFNALSKANFILGEESELFEKKFAHYCGASYCVGLDNGSSALEFALRALGIGENDEVITPVNSFIASSSAISFVGAKPVWVDCDPETYLIDTSKIERNITKNTKAIMPVHLYGRPVPMDEIMNIAKRHKLYVIEDACQAHGAKYKGKPVGSWGDAAAFSFYPGKNLGAFGDAGALTTNSKKIYEYVRTIRNYGQTKKYYHSMLAWNRRLDNVQAAVLLVKLKYLTSWNKKRRLIAKQYNNLLKDLPIVLPLHDNNESVYHLYVIRTNKRDKLQKYLSTKGIQSLIHYPIPIHLQKAYDFMNIKKGSFPVTEKYAKQFLSLPMYPELTHDQLEYISEAMHVFYS